MKTLSIYAVILFSVFATTQSIAQNSVVKETFKVWGNCGMCKKTIERAAKTAGAATASWNEETKQLSLSYSAKKTTTTKIQQAIANAGYDTPRFTADDKAYSDLNRCCQYERKGDTVINAAAKACCDSPKGCNDENVCKAMTACKEKDCCKM